MSKALVLVVCFILQACVMVGPNYKEPQKKIASHWLPQHAVHQGSSKQNAAWWTVFQDKTLTNLIDQGYHHNLNLQIAGAHVLQARAQLAQAVGELYPQQQAIVGNYTSQRIGGTSLEDVLPNSFKTASLGLSASWEIDFWGKYRRAVLANDAVFLSSIAAYDNALVSLTADIASQYTLLRTDEALIKVTQSNIKRQTMSLHIAESRYKAGETSLLDVAQAKTELAQTQASLPKLIRHLQQQKDALAVLLGTVPTRIDSLLINNKAIPKAPPTVAVSIPKEALARRPDIHQARLDAIAQLETIGAIKANLYPSLSLLGSFNFAGNNIGNSSLSDMFQWANRNVTAGSGLNWPILNYGQITNAVRAQDAIFQQALLAYLQLVLKAQQEVQDNITRYMQAKKTTQALIKANDSAIQTTALALIRYKEGETNYTTVLDAQRQLLQIQSSLTRAQGEIPLALIALYRSLGGGWQIRKNQDILSPAVKKEMATRTNWGTLLEQTNHQAPKTKQQQNQQRLLPNW